MFIEAKRKAKKQIAEEIKQAAMSTSPPSINSKKNSFRNQLPPKIPIKQDNEDTKEIKIFKLFKEISEME